MDFVCIDRLEGDGLNARTVAVWSDGQFEDNVTYALKDTPCGDVVGKEVCCFPASVCQFFPHDQVLRDLRAESYVGVTLWSRTGQPIGLIAVIGRHPLANRSRVEAVLKMVAMRTAGELEQQESEQRLHANQERYRTILQTAMDGFWMTDMQGRIQEVNEAYCQMSGYSMQEMLAMHITDLEAGETAGETAAHIQKVLIQGKDRFTSRHRRKDGSTFYVEVSVQVRPTEGGQLVAFLRDVSSQKLMEDRILSMSRFPEENPQPILRMSLDGTITYSNIPGEMLLKHWGLHVGQVAPEEWCTWVAETLDSDKNKENVVDLGQIVFLIILVPIREGRYVNLYGRDITKQRQYDESLRQSRDNLQTLVEVRTQDLAHSVIRLQEEIRERHIAEEELHQNHLKLKMLSARVEFAEEQERRRIASDLHDSVGQILAFTIREIQAMQKVAPKKLSGSLHELSDQLDKAVEQTRTLSFDLSPNILYDIGFEVAVEDLTERFARENQIRCRFENCGSPKILTDPVKVLLYRSIRELLINIAKHAEAEVAEVALKRIGDQLRITVRDDGRGFAITEDGKSKGFGLFSIRERLYHIGGRLEMESAKGHGTTITLIVPFSIEDEGRKE
jgi:PAS domain S-box-containing protein